MKLTQNLICLTLSLMFASPAGATPDPNAELATLDEALNRWKDQVFSYEMIDSQPGKSDRTLALDVLMKGEKRVTAFTAPADVKGTRILILSETQMYVYLPAYSKVRRIASHMTAQGFMGTAYSQDDLAITTYADKYEAKTLSEGEKTLKVELLVRAGKEVAYPKIHMTIDTERHLPIELTYFDDKGTKLKTETRTDYKCDGNICVPYTMKMQDHTSPGHETRLVTTKWTLNSDLKDSVFTRRYLQRGR